TSCRKPAWRPRVWPRIRGWASGPRAAHKPASTSTAFLQAKDTPDDEAVRADHVVIIRRFCASRGSRGIFAAANRSPPPLLLGFPLHRGAAQPVSAGDEPFGSCGDAACARSMALPAKRS